MTDKKPMGASAAAREIACISAMRSKDVEAIILKHCPEDKAGKLVEALRDVEARKDSEFGCHTRPYNKDYELGFCAGAKLISKQYGEIAATALAEYEKVKK